MADALCGPSNALQNFQKHTTVDRTLQQDRLVGRHSPSQGFRSSHGAHPGALDSEFEAFQAGHVGPPQPDFQQLPPHLARPPPPPQFAQAPLAPDWASDFQRLSLSSAHTPSVQQQRTPVSNASSWHQDFMQQQAPAVQAPMYQQQNGFGGMSGYGMSRFGGSSFQQPGFAGMNGGLASEVAQGKQRAHEPVPQFDEAAFEQAFAQAQQDMLDEATAEQERIAENERIVSENAQNLRRAGAEAEARSIAEEDAMREEPELLRIREKRPAVYAALKVRSAIDLGRLSEASTYFTILESMEPNNKLTEDVSEAKWVVDALQRIAARDAPQEMKIRAERLVTSINQRLMSSYPLLSSRVPISQSSIWEELEAAGYTGSPVQQQAQPQPEQKEEQQPPKNDDDEMAETAGRLLERVADNTSTKFQNSQFLELMRRLRDREVRVEGDKMVEVSTQSSTITPSQPQQLQPAQQEATIPSSTTAIPPIDPKILDHAATDFDLPVYSDQDPNHDEYALSRQSSTTGEPATDEISDQFSYYNIHAAYHR